ncbi:MAG: DUF4268 domain-containing protein [Candidatus Bathyarchaeota archaeon]|nr:DUF4268 domain-containing protein [Candidatus Bathyarchaeota archaeon]
MTISRLKRVPLRVVWKNEEKDFTPWLQKNLDVLSEAMGMELSPGEREASVGKAFEADLLAEGTDGDLVVIENQFGKSDHDHLGKILTYLVNLNAKTAIWICENPQPEHMEAIDWLNKSSAADISFYLVRLEAFQVGDSQDVGPHFSIVSEPSSQIKEAGETVEELAERHVKRRQFWTQLLPESNKKTQLFSNISASKDHWISAGAGISGVVYQYLILKDGARVQLAIEGSDQNRNKAIFDGLSSVKDLIEKDFGEQLAWNRLDNKKASYITKSVIDKGLRDKEEWPKIIEKLVEEMVRLEKAISPHLK